nr:MAG TPA: hypothetical protein [Caudoviricetes sp.]
MRIQSKYTPLRNKRGRINAAFIDTSPWFYYTAFFSLLQVIF